MRRSEEGLGYWLSGAPSPPEQDLAPGFTKRFLARLHGLELRSVVGEQSLEIRTSTVDLDPELTADAQVQNGLGAFALPAGISDEIGKSPTKVTEIDLPHNAVVRDLVCPNESVTRVVSWKLLPVTNTRFITTNLRPGMVRAIGNLGIVQVNDGRRLLLAEPYIRNQMPLMTAIPHRRAGTNASTLQDSERREFLDQAQFLKGVRSENGEVIAVFRHVPIEMITRLHYLEKERAIVYSISSVPRRTRTRVHDMAAVRDNANGEIHVIPRRTHVSLRLEI
jgi:hypothetical protein